MTEEKYLAKVGDKVITAADVESAINSLDAFQKQQFDNEEGRKRILADLINQELFYLDALENKLDEDERFINDMERVKENMLKQFAINLCLSNIEMTDDEKLDFYEKNKEQFKTPETVNAKHILVESEDQIKDIEKKLNKKEISFEDAALQYSTCPSSANGGELGVFTRGQMVPEFEEAAFNQPVGKISEPVKTDFGYHLILVTEHNDEAQQEYEDVKDQVTNALGYQKQNEAFLKKMDELTDKYKDLLVINNGSEEK